MSRHLSLRWHSDSRRNTALVLLAAFSFQCGSLTAGSAPAWWSTRGVIASGAMSDDYAAINQGQLKNLATAAAVEFNATLPGGAGSTVNTLVSSWQTPKASTDDFAAVTLGQLKAVATPFYERLRAVGFAVPDPWSAGASAADDHAIANAGQAKTIFAFGIEPLTTDAQGHAVAARVTVAPVASGLVSKTYTAAPGSPGAGGGGGGTTPTTPGGTAVEPQFVFYARKKSAWAYPNGYKSDVSALPPGAPVRHFTTHTEITMINVQHDYQHTMPDDLTGSGSTTWTKTGELSRYFVQASLTPIVSGSTLEYLGWATLARDTSGHATWSYASTVQRPNGTETEQASGTEQFSGSLESPEMTSYQSTYTRTFPDDSTLSDSDSGTRYGTTLGDGDADSRAFSGLGLNLVSEFLTRTEIQTTSLRSFEVVPQALEGVVRTGTHEEYMTSTLSGEILQSSVVGRVLADIGSEPWSGEFQRTTGAVSSFGIGRAPEWVTDGGDRDAGWVTADDVEYYVALEWPAGTTGTPAQQATARTCVWMKNYKSDDGSIDKMELRSVTLRPGEMSGKFALSAITENKTKSGRESIAFTPMEILAFPVRDDGTISPQAEPVRISTPSPLVNVSNCAVTNLHVNTDGDLRGDVHVSGTISSTLCDTIPGEKGTITTAQFYVNGADEPHASIAVNAQKASNGPVGRPHPFAGTFNQVIANVPLTSGNNVFEIHARDKISMNPGYNTWHVEIEPDDMAGDSGVPPILAATSTSASVSTPANGLVYEGVDSLTMTITADAESPETVALTKSAAASNIFHGTTANGIQVMVTATKVPDGQPLRMMSAVMQFGGISRSVRLTGADSGTFFGGYTRQPATVDTPDDPPEPVPPLPSFIVGQAGQVGASNGGEHFRYALGIVRPQNLPEDTELAITVGPQRSEMKLYKQSPSSDIMLAKHEQAAEEDDRPAIVSWLLPSEAPTETQTPDAALIADLEKNQASFAKGFALGMGAGGAQMVGGLVDLAENWARYSGRGLALTGYGILAGINQENYYLDNLAVELSAAQNSVHENIEKTVKSLRPLAELIVNNHELAFRAEVGMMTGDLSWMLDDKSLKTSMTNMVLFEIGSEVVSKAMEDFKDDSSGVKGYKMGRVIFELAMIILPWTKLGKVAGSAKAQLLTKFRQTRIGSLLSARTIEEIIAVENALKGGCFVAGTKVLTKGGLRNIEDIQAGELVWSRHEFDPSLSDWRPVVTTMVTHPAVIHHLTYSLRGPPSAASEGSQTETIGVTANHPMWVVNSMTPGWKPAGSLQQGDILSLADGDTAMVVANDAETASDDSTFTTYNFEVSEFHTYFVGTASVWVHNACPWREFLKHLGDASSPLKGNIAKAYDEMKRLRGANLSELEKQQFIETVVKDTGELRKHLSQRMVELGTEGADWVPNEAFAAARFEAKTGRTLQRSGTVRADFKDEFGRLWDAWGPAPGQYSKNAAAWNKLIQSLEKHVIDPEKGNAIIDLAGLDATQKWKVLQHLEDIGNPSGKLIEILLDN